MTVSLDPKQDLSERTDVNIVKSTHQPTQSSRAILPLEIVLLIAEHLTSSGHLASLSSLSTCTLSYRHVLVPVLYRHITITRSNLPSILRSRRNLTHTRSLSIAALPPDSAVAILTAERGNGHEEEERRLRGVLSNVTQVTIGPEGMWQLANHLGPASLLHPAIGLPGPEPHWNDTIPIIFPTSPNHPDGAHPFLRLLLEMVPHPSTLTIHYPSLTRIRREEWFTEHSPSSGFQEALDAGTYDELPAHALFARWNRFIYDAFSTSLSQLIDKWPSLSEMTFHNVVNQAIPLPPSGGVQVWFEHCQCGTPEFTYGWPGIDCPDHVDERRRAKMIIDLLSSVEAGKEGGIYLHGVGKLHGVGGEVEKGKAVRVSVEKTCPVIVRNLEDQQKLLFVSGGEERARELVGENAWKHRKWM